MQKRRFYIGIDIADKTFYASIFSTPQKPHISKEFTNSMDGFQQFVAWLKQQKVSPGNSIICMEATGVYCDNLCYYVSSQNYPLVLEAPHKVKKAFTHLDKNDRVDSQQISEYAYRFKDKLTLWEPKSYILEQIQVLLTTREQLLKQRSANKNSLKAVKRKYVRTPLAEKTFQQSIDHLSKQVETIEKEIEKLIKKDTDFHQMKTLITSIPAVGNLLYYNLLVTTKGFTENINSKNLASYFGIAPHEHSSGSSIFKKAKSQRRGPKRPRKFIYLASLSLRTHNKCIKMYFMRKVAEGKSGRLVLNNIANKLIKIICAIARDRKPYIEGYLSINPQILLNNT
ncbi:MAG: IS110 family transposase [Candidatus Scalindua sediminis]|nr:IS110 family transposase [Candidatus Scalindua sediminis]